MIDTSIARPPVRWFLRGSSPSRAKLRLFCFPHAGGAPAAYLAWSPYLPSTVELLILQLPGRGSRIWEAPFTSMHQLAEAVGSAILPLLGDSPYVLFGHSMGALSAFEVARWLRRGGLRIPAHILVSGHQAPQCKPVRDTTLHLQSDSDLIADVRRLNGTPEEILENSALLEIMLPTLRADYQVTKSYQCTAEQPLTCPISVLGGLYDPETSREGLEAWANQTTGSCRLHMFPGDHFFVLKQATYVLPVIARMLEELI
ncbi:thioesterase (plasmid) [Bradyrhizobium sp. LCT2]|uniref:thioesterase II family protein n=1 Tax=Bradyrhizobium sp. LCT2 TaxID=2493093 RepID=UPI001374279E|nr:alpha/beta fold hydrolase [Bradyrhizobium sp. LCT2]QHP66043.1 thioesterase [Bradyrhizobium sp. LCT2]